MRPDPGRPVLSSEGVGCLTTLGIPKLDRTLGTFSSSIWPIENRDDVNQYMNNPY